MQDPLLDNVPEPENEFVVLAGSDPSNPGADEPADNVITLQDEEGNEHEFEVIDIVEVNSKEYAVLVPVENDEGETDEELALVLRFEDETLVMIEDEAEFNAVVEYLENMASEESNNLGG